jgi:hypothetical protein
VILKPKSPLTKGNRRWRLRIEEVSYEPIVPMKGENRRALATGGHGIHWRDLAASINQAWLKAAERSLTENQQSFAVLEMSEVLLPNDLLAMLKAKGYTVLGPADATYAAAVQSPLF